MSFQLPTLQDLLDRTRKAFRTSLPGSDAWIWPNNITVSAKVIAGAVFEWFGALAYVSKMIFVHTAPDLETLVRHGAEYGMAQKPAQPAAGTIRLTSSGDNLNVDVGAIFSRTDDVQYVASAAGSRVGAGTLDIPATTLVDGAGGNTEAGTPITIISGVTGGATAAVQADFVGGADVEDIESFRARILFRKRYPPHGGAAPDYVGWAMAVSGVTRVFVERLWAGVGTVRVFVLMDDLYPNGIPTDDAIARVADFIETVRPAGALVTVQAPSPLPVDITVLDMEPNTAAEQKAARAALKEAFRRLSRVAGNDTPHGGMPFLATPASFSLSWIWNAVADATGEERHKITNPADDLALTSGQIAVLGNVTFATS